MTTFILIVLAAIVGVCGGWYLKGRFGAVVKRHVDEII